MGTPNNFIIRVLGVPRGTVYLYTALAAKYFYHHQACVEFICDCLVHYFSIIIIYGYMWSIYGPYMDHFSNTKFVWPKMLFLPVFFRIQNFDDPFYPYFFEYGDPPIVVVWGGVLLLGIPLAMARD